MSERNLNCADLILVREFPNFFSVKSGNFFGAVAYTLIKFQSSLVKSPYLEYLLDSVMIFL